MIIALANNGVRIELYKQWKKENLLHLKETQEFHCPCCLQEVQLKLGEKRMWHFAHKRDQTCSIELEAESDYHMRGKIQLFTWIKRLCSEVHLEHYIPSIKQRPDIFFINSGKKYAIEYQCSPLTPDLFRKRSESYLKASIIPIWILGGKRLNRKSENALYLTAFDWLCVRSRYIIYFCSDTSQFMKASSLVSFSSKYTFADIQFFPPGNTSLSLFHRTNSTPQFSFRFLSTWKIKKKRWRLTSYLQASISKKEFYQNGITLQLTPAEAGIPLQSLYMIESPAIEWQSYILYFVIYPLKIGDTITLTTVVRKVICHELFKLRNTPLDLSNDLFIVIREYFQTLVFLNKLKEVKKNCFQKINPITFPSHINEALELDSKVLDRIKKIWG